MCITFCCSNSALEEKVRVAVVTGPPPWITLGESHPPLHSQHESTRLTARLCQTTQRAPRRECCGRCATRPECHRTVVALGKLAASCVNSVKKSAFVLGNSSPVETVEAWGHVMEDGKVGSKCDNVGTLYVAKRQEDPQLHSRMEAIASCMASLDKLGKQYERVSNQE